MHEDLKKSYELAWEQFAASVRQIAGRVELAAENSGNIHLMLGKLYDVPYYQAKNLILQVGSGNSTLNPGPLTGLFFETLVGASVRGFLRANVPGARLTIGRGPQTFPAHLPPNPDICVTHGKNTVVFELKVSPKKPDLDYVKDIRARHEKAGVSYFLIGGEVSGRRESLMELGEEGWVAFLCARSERNREAIEKATIDRLLGAAARELLA